MSEHRSDHLGDDELRAAYMDASAAAAGATHRADCPSPDALRAAVRGEGGDPAERLRVLDLALACPACRRELALLHAVSEPPRRGVIPIRAAWQGRSWGRSWGRLVPLAAAASVLVAVGVFRVGRGGGRDDVVRAAAADPALVAPAPGAALAGGPVAFVWRRVPGAFRYTLELDAADGAVLYATQTADTALVVPLGGAPAGEHRWSVRARLDDGSERRSESRPLRLRR